MIPTTLAAAIGCTDARAELYAPYINEACEAFEINTQQRLAAFLAQIGHESGSFAYTEEISSGDAYEGRISLGNTQQGDGRRFKGRGLIQTTGRYNYAATRDGLARFHCPDFEDQPEALTEPRWAALSAGWYWYTHGCNELADAGDFEAVTRRINGALNGQPDRLRRWEKAKAGLAPELPPVETHVPVPVVRTTTMPAPLIPIIAALLPTLIEAIPKLKALFPGGEVSERNVKVAETAFRIAQDALQATNAQAVVEQVQADPVAAQTAAKAIAANWFELSEAGGGGIEGARAADAAFVAGRSHVWDSPSFWAMVLLLPLVYIVVGAVVGLFGRLTLNAEVAASILTGVVTLVIGSATGFYFGSTTSRNKPGA